MITVITMCVIMYTAKTIIEKVRPNNQQHCRNKKPKLVLMPDLFAKQQSNTCSKQNKWQQTMMMFLPAMVQGVGTNTKSQQDHK